MNDTPPDAHNGQTPPSAPPGAPQGPPPRPSSPLEGLEKPDLSIKEGGPAWEGDGSLIQRMVSTILQLVAHPMKTFESEGPQGGDEHLKPLLFALFATVPFVFVGVLYQPVLQVAFLYLGALLSYIGLMLFKVQKGGFFRTFRVAAYSRAVYPLFLIPYLGKLGAPIWGAVIFVLGCVVVHKAREENTVAKVVIGSLVLPVAAGVVFGLIMLILLIF